MSLVHGNFLVFSIVSEEGMAEFKVPRTFFFFTKMNICKSHCCHFFLPLINLRNQASFAYDQVRRGVGVFLILGHNLL